MNETKSGVGFPSLLTLLFIALKITSVIDWSWWWVLAPTWVPLTLGLLLLGIVAVLERYQNKR